MSKKINVRFKPELREELERDWKPLRSFSRKRRMGWVDDYFEAFHIKYVITNVTPHRVHFFATPVEIEEKQIKSEVRYKISEQAMKRIKPIPTMWGMEQPLIGVMSPSPETYDAIRNTLRERIKPDSSLSFKEKYQIAMEVAYSYSPSEWYDTVTFTNLVFEALQGNNIASKLCGMN